MQGKNVGLWDSCGLKQGNPLQIFQIDNQVILFLFTFLWFSFSYQFLLKVISLYMWGKIYVGNWERYGLNQGNPLQNFQITNQIILFLFFFGFFTFYIKKYIKSKIFVYVREKICRTLRQLQTEKGESLDFLKNH